MIGCFQLNAIGRESKRMKQHVKVVGALHIGLGSLGILIACIVFVVLVGIARLADDVEAPRVLEFIGTVTAIFLSLISLPGIIGGIGLLQEREWARILVLILSGLNLFNVPIGTAVGLYSIWVLLQEETVQLFNTEAR
jgi:hypothetical protein